MSKISLPISVRFKADLSIEEFSAALSSAIEGNLSGLVGSFSATCPYLKNEKALQRVELLSAGIVSRVEQAEAKEIEAALRVAEARIAEARVEPTAHQRIAEPIRRSLNPRGRNSDDTVYKLRNLDGRTASGTQVELRRKLGIGTSRFYQLLNTPGRVTQEGWYLPTARAARSAAAGRQPDPTVYEVQNLYGATFSGTRREIAGTIGTGLPTVVKMLKTPGYTTSGGWSLKSASQAGE